MDKEECKGQSIKIKLLNTWGDYFYVGLTYIEVLGQQLQPIKLNRADITSNDKLNEDHIQNVIRNDMKQHWLVPLQQSQHIWLNIKLPEQYNIKGLKIWNYCKSLEDGCRGAKQILVYLDNMLVSPKHGFIIKKADFTQSEHEEQSTFIPLYRDSTSEPLYASHYFNATQ